MENTINFSVRTRINTLKDFDTILNIRNLSRSKVIESFMQKYIKDFRAQQQEGVRLSGKLSKYKGVASGLTPEIVADDPRAKHALGYD